MPPYLVAVLAVAAAAGAGLLVDRFLQSAPFVSLFLCAILLAAWVGGLGPGLLATGLSILAFDYFFVSPLHSFGFGLDGGLRIALFTIAALFVVWVSVAQKRTAESLRRARDDLRATVAELRRSEIYSAEAQRLSNTGSFGWKIGTDQIFWSKETYRIMGFDETVTPTIGLLLQRVHPDDRGFVQRQLDRALQGEQHFDYEYRLKLPDGEIKDIHVRAHRQAYETGEEELIGALMDVTATKQAQEALQIAQTALAHVTRVTMLGEMTTSIAHEVNQPLGAIVTNAGASLRWLRLQPPRDRRGAHRDRANCQRRPSRQRGDSQDPQVLEERRPRDDPPGHQRGRRRGGPAPAARRASARSCDSGRTRAGPAPGARDRIQLQQVIVNLLVNGM